MMKLHMRTLDHRDIEEIDISRPDAISLIVTIDGKEYKIADRGGQLSISCDGQLTITPVASNWISVKEGNNG